MPQGPAPTAPTHTSQTGGPPQAPPVNNQNRNHQDPPECNGTTNGPTRAPADGKGPGPAKGKIKMSEPWPGTSSGTGSTTQPAGHTIVCSACGESGHWSKNCPYYNFCDICRVTTHSTHMCRASKHGNATARSPVCIYCSKTNYGSAYCRYMWCTCTWIPITPSTQLPTRIEYTAEEDAYLASKRSTYSVSQYYIGVVTSLNLCVYIRYLRELFLPNKQEESCLL